MNRKETDFEENFVKDEVQQLVDEFENWTTEEKILFLSLSYTGVRLSEVKQLKFEDIRLDRKSGRKVAQGFAPHAFQVFFKKNRRKP